MKCGRRAPFVQHDARAGSSYTIGTLFLNRLNVEAQSASPLSIKQLGML